jgi:hypothetical protein
VNQEQTDANIQGMTVRLIALMLLLVSPGLRFNAMAQDCKFGSEDAFDATAKMLSEAKSCNSAVTIMHNCAWGSSADSQLAPIAIGKCEKLLREAVRSR